MWGESACYASTACAIIPVIWFRRWPLSRPKPEAEGCRQRRETEHVGEGPEAVEGEVAAEEGGGEEEGGELKDIALQADGRAAGQRQGEHGQAIGGQRLVAAPEEGRGGKRGDEGGDLEGVVGLRRRPARAWRRPRL